VVLCKFAELLAFAALQVARMGRAIGIDLGTSNSVVAVMDGKQAVVIPDAEGNRIQPSVVSFGFGNQVLVGHRARRQAASNPENTVASAKRLIGRKFFSMEVKRARDVCAYEIVEGPNQDVRIRVHGRDYTLQEISAHILLKMKAIAEEHLGEAVTQAVITVPAYFNDGQRQATKDAGAIAGLDVLRIINEPTAAALAYGFGRNTDKRIAVYDLGGGTFDISILQISGDVFEVISTAGDTFLGGDDMDSILVDYFASRFNAAEKIDLRKSKAAVQKLKEAAEDAKKRLSTEFEVEVFIPGVIKDPFGRSRDLKDTLTRPRFNEMIYPYIQRTFKVCDEALQAARMTTVDIDAVILVGGTTRVPLVRESVERYFRRKPEFNINPDEVVAIGAAIQADTLSRATGSTEALGALLIDVTPQSLGIATVGGFVEKLIFRNAPIPTEQRRVFATSSDNQTSVKIAVYQGESKLAADNEMLAQFVLDGLPPAPRGKTKIEVTFEIDPNGILQVRARDPDTGISQSVQIAASGGLSSEAVEKLKFETLGF
jgi:molecular chaperone DnaK